jgi:hypothetical protein
MTVAISLDLERYESHIDRSGGPDACHPWTGSRFKKGYGDFHVGGRTEYAHRWGYLALVGPIPPETPHVLHHCDNPPCQNRSHWFLGTNADNVADRESKGRGVIPDNRGELHGMATLTELAVEEIRKRYASGTVLQRDLAREFGVTQSAISRVINRVRWAD